MESPFIGASRSELVDVLVDHFDGVVQEGRPRLVTLEASSGWGKTRLVQELFKRLAAERQPEGDYWPLSIIEAQPDERPPSSQGSSNRKLVHPRAWKPVDGAELEWFWWGLSCTARRDGTPVEALATDLAQIAGHSDALERRWRKLSSAPTRFKRAVQSRNAKDLLGSGSEEAATAGVEALANVAVPGLGFLISAGRLAIREGRQRRDRSRTEHVVDLGRSVDRDSIGELEKQLGQFTEAGIPFIVVLEDAHEADQTLSDFLSGVLSRGRGPILVIATSWPGRLEEDDVPASSLLGSVGSGRFERLIAQHVPPLDAVELAQIAIHRVPGSRPAAAAALAQHLANPLAVELAVSLPRIQRALQNGDVAAMEQIPRDVERLYSEVWKTLPKELQVGLVHAAVLVPSSISELVPSDEYDIRVVAAAAAASEWVVQGVDELHYVLGSQATAYGWVHELDEWLRRFVEPSQLHTARSAADDYYTQDDLHGLRRAAAASILAATSDSAPRTGGMVIALALEGFLEWSDEVVAAALDMVLELSRVADTASLRRSVKLGQTLREVAQLTTEEDAAVRTAMAYSVGELGQVGKAIQHLEELLAELSEERDLATFVTEDARRALAHWLGSSSRYEEAARELTRLISDYEQLDVGPTTITVEARRNLASAMGFMGAPQEAVRQLELLVEAVEAVPELDVLGEVRTDLAFWLMKAEAPEAAARQLHQVLERREQALGTDHPDTMGTRSNLAYLLKETGQHEEALVLFRSLLADQQRFLGADHPGAMVTKHNVAHLLGEMGTYDEAILMFRELLAERETSVGVDHPSTLSTRSDLAHFTGTRGEAAAAAQLLRDLLVDRERLLGTDHADTVATRVDLIHWLAEAKLFHEAAAETRHQLLFEERAGGPDHPNARTARHNLAALLAEGGDLKSAQAELTRLLDDLERLLGVNHPKTMKTRFILAALDP